MCSYNMQCVAGQPPDLSVLVAIYLIGVCLNKHYSLKVLLIVSFHKHSL